MSPVSYVCHLIPACTGAVFISSSNNVVSDGAACVKKYVIGHVEQSSTDEIWVP